MSSNNLFNIQLSPKLSSYLIHSKDYEKIRKLGKGSYGHVDLVKNITTNDKYAMKTIYFNYDFSDDDVQSFYREVEIMAEVNHPSVLRLNGFSLPTKKREYATILTPYMSNGSLEVLLRKTNRSNENIQKIDLKNNEFEFNLAQKLIIIYGIAAGMQYLHHMNIIHRDLKPGNILLNDRYEPFIGDFGFSKFTETKNTVKQSMTGGTPLYMAPELYDNYTYGFKVDVYAFGMLMYEVLSGMEPFEEVKNPNSIPLKVCNGARPNIPSFIPHPFKFLIKNCWSADPAERFSFDEIVEYLLKIDLIECIKNDHGIGSDSANKSSRKKRDKGTPSKKKRNALNQKKNKSKGRNQNDDDDYNDDYDEKSDKSADNNNSEEFDDEEEEIRAENEYILLKRYIERVLAQPYIFSTINKLNEETTNLTKKVKSLELTVQNLSLENVKLHRIINNILSSIKSNNNDNSNSINDEDEDENEAANDDTTDTENRKLKKNSKGGNISDIKSDGFLFENDNPLYNLSKNRDMPKPQSNQPSTPKVVGFNGYGNYITTFLQADNRNNGVMTPKKNINSDSKLNIFNYSTANDFLKKDLVVKFDSHHGIIETLKNQQRSPFEKIVIESQSSGDIYQIINSASADRYTSSSEDGHSWIQFRFPESIQLTGIKLTSSRNHFIRSWRFIALVAPSATKGKSKNKNKGKSKNKNKKKGDIDEDNEYSSSSEEYEYEYEYDFSRSSNGSEFEEEEDDDDDISDYDDRSDDDEFDYRRKKNKKKRENRRNRNRNRKNKKKKLKLKKIVIYENDNERQLNKQLAELKVKFSNPVSSSIYRIEQTGPAWDDKKAISLKNVEFQTKKEFLNQIQSSDLITSGNSSGNNSNSDNDEASDSSNKLAIIDLFTSILESVNGEPHRVNVLITSNDFDFGSYQLLNTDTCLQTYSKPVPPWFQVEFSRGTLQAFGYRIRRNDQMMLKSWSLIASNDKDLKLEKWEVIHSVNESKEGDLGTLSTFKIKNKMFFKYFRLVQKKPCWDGSNVLVLYHFDLFGHYKEDF